MRKSLFFAAILILINLYSFSQAKRDVKDTVQEAMTDSTEFLSITDISVALYNSGQLLSDKITKKHWDEIMDILQKEFIRQVNVAEQRRKNKKKVK